MVPNSLLAVVSRICTQSLMKESDFKFKPLLYHIKIYFTGSKVPG